MVSKVHYSSNNDEWETPKKLYKELHKEFNFEVDLCSTAKNKKCKMWVKDIVKYYESLLKGTTVEFISHTFFMNPPYSRGKLYLCIKYAKLISKLGKRVVCLIPSRTDTKVWHDFIWDNKKNCFQCGVKGRFLKGRICFEQNGKPILDNNGKPSPAPFPSCIIIFDGRKKK